MAFIKNAFLLALLLFTAATTAAENLPIQPGQNLGARLEPSGGLVECWNALYQLKSCNNEMVQFFLSGAIMPVSIGPGCCGAIDVITRKCWPSMLTSIGFTAEEGNILKVHCDGAYYPPPVAQPLVTVSPADDDIDRVGLDRRLI